MSSTMQKMAYNCEDDDNSKDRANNNSNHVITATGMAV